MRGFILRVWRFVIHNKLRSGWQSVGRWRYQYWRDFDEYVGHAYGNGEQWRHRHGWNCNGYHKRWRRNIDRRRDINNSSYPIDGRRSSAYRWRRHNDCNRWRVRFHWGHLGRVERNRWLDGYGRFVRGFGSYRWIRFYRWHLDYWHE